MLTNLKNQTNILNLDDFQKKIFDIYGEVDDRLYSVTDLLYFNQKFTFDYLKSRRKKEFERAEENIVISLSWFMGLANRYHIKMEDKLWKRYPYKCPHCLDIPCSCAEGQKISLSKIGRPPSRKPKSIKQWLKMLHKIFPDDKINQLDLGLLEALNDFNYAVRLYVKEKNRKYFLEIENKSADALAYYLRISNLLSFDLAEEIENMFRNGCHVCGKIPCCCSFY